MARHSAIDDPFEAVSPLREQDRAAPPPAQSPALDMPGFLRVLMRAHLLRGDVPAATRVAARLGAEMPGQPEPLDLLVEAALDLGRVQVARQILSTAEPSPMQSAQLRARIAQSQGDFDSAKAILVMAIEDLPEAAPLRTHLAEVMVAAGTAAEARAVLAHIGQPPVNPATPGDRAADQPDPTRLPSSRIG